MTSTANASNSGSSTPGKQSQNSTNGRATMKAAAGSKGADGMRKQNGSPADASSRPPPKAWASGTNPLTQRPNASPAHQNGTPSQRPVQQTPGKDNSTADQHAHDRLVFVCAASIGNSVTVTTSNADLFKGIMSSSVLDSNDRSVTLKMVQQLSQSDAQVNGVTSSIHPYIGSGADHAMTFDLKDVAQVSMENLSFADIKSTQNGTTAGFRTDTDISGKRDQAERQLQRWVPDESVGPDMSLESAGGSTWDQFETNEKKFGTQSTYDENLYTTAINRNDPSYRERAAAAEKLAREIEGSTSTNVHIREERGQALENEVDDEEAKYSGVHRGQPAFPTLSSGQGNKYTPPARRAPTGMPTIAGAPFDPAIISAQLSKPDSGPRQARGDSMTLEPATAEAVATPKEAASTEAPTKPAAAGQDAPEQSTSGKGRSINTSVSPNRKLPVAENATEGVEKELLNHFRSFANSEKQKVQERRRVQANHDRTAKLNELKRFSSTFKLNTPVPKDLVPILAKDPSKQELIIDKAVKQAEEKKKVVVTASTSAAASPAATPDVKTPSRPAATARAEPSTGANVTDRQNQLRGRQGYPPTGPQSTQPGRMQQNLPSRGPSSGYMNRMGSKGGQQGPIPTPLDPRMTPNQSITTSGLTSPNRSALHTPSSAITKGFNVGAIEFRPNPSASSFNPSGSVAASSPPSTARTASVSRAPSPAAFFGAKKPTPASDRPKFSSFFNPIKRMKKESAEQPAGKNYSSNGGIPEPYRTQVRWDVPEANVEKTYRDAVDRSTAPPPVSPSNRSVSSSSYIPHQHQLPPHMQQNGGSSVSHTPPSGPHAMQASHSQQTHYDDHRIHGAGGTPQVYPSPRVSSTPMMYQSPMAGQAPVYGQPAPQYFPQGQMPMQMRGGYPGQPQFIQPQAVPMMAQHSQGPYMQVPQQFNQQMQMYSPAPAQVYPAHVAQPHSGYPSPGRGAPMMMHQGSQQGHHPQGMMYVGGQPGQAMYNPQQGHMPMRQPGYPTPSAGYPQPQFHSPQHPQRHPSSGYGHGHMPQKTPQHMTPQQQPQSVAPSHSEQHLAEDGAK